jgi:hypothetical protein
MAIRKRAHSGRKGNVTEKDFMVVHKMADAKLDRKTISELSQWGKSTVGRILLFETYDEYLNHLKELADRQTPKPTKEEMDKAIDELRAKVTKIPTTIDIDKAVEDITNPEPMERIATALERLAEAWEQQPKRGLFK